MVALGYKEVKWNWMCQGSAVFYYKFSSIIQLLKHIYVCVHIDIHIISSSMYTLLLTNFHISMEAMVTPKNVPEKLDLCM